jgi:hypothetical protein
MPALSAAWFTCPTKVFYLPPRTVLQQCLHTLLCWRACLLLLLMWQLFQTCHSTLRTVSLSLLVCNRHASELTASCCAALHACFLQYLPTAFVVWGKNGVRYERDIGGVQILHPPFHVASAHILLMRYDAQIMAVVYGVLPIGIIHARHLAPLNAELWLVQQFQHNVISGALHKRSIPRHPGGSSTMRSVKTASRPTFCFHCCCLLGIALLPLHASC